MTKIEEQKIILLKLAGWSISPTNPKENTCHLTCDKLTYWIYNDIDRAYQMELTKNYDQ